MSLHNNGSPPVRTITGLANCVKSSSTVNASSVEISGGVFFSGAQDERQ